MIKELDIRWVLFPLMSALSYFIGGVNLWTILLIASGIIPFKLVVRKRS